jgi:hypothetical protein
MGGGGHHQAGRATIHGIALAVKGEVEGHKWYLVLESV